EPEQREQRRAEGRPVEPQPALEAEGNAERAEPRLDRRPPAVGRRADDRDLVERGPGAGKGQDLGADELERAARAGALEEADGALERRRLERRVAEERALEMEERRRAPGGRRAEDLDAALGQRGQVFRGALEG